MEQFTSRESGVDETGGRLVARRGLDLRAVQASNFSPSTRTAEQDARSKVLDGLWIKWQQTKDPETRNRIAQAYFPLVKHVARAVAATLSDRAELDDLIGFGSEGLLNAITRFDTGRGIQFSTFAAYRIRGAIFDGIRTSDWVPRSMRRREREIRENFAWLCTEFGREPSEQEEADLLGISLDSFRAVKGQLFRSGISSLPGAAAEFDQRSEASVVELPPDPLDVCLIGEELGELQHAIDQLSEREHSVIAMSFQGEKTLAEIGKILGVTESRVCQVRGTALKKLRSSLEARGMVPV